jgi:hypothetical protein
LYYETLDGRMMAVEIEADVKGVSAQTPRELFPAAVDVSILHSFDATPDGQRFLILGTSRTAPSEAQLKVVTNWQAAVRR